MLKLLSVMTGDNRYASILSSDKEGVMTMCDVAERLEQRGIKRGIEQGIKQGAKRGVQNGKNAFVSSGRQWQAVSFGCFSGVGTDRGRIPQ